MFLKASSVLKPLGAKKIWGVLRGRRQGHWPSVSLGVSPLPAGSHGEMSPQVPWNDANVCLMKRAEVGIVRGWSKVSFVHRLCLKMALPTTWTASLTLANTRTWLSSKSVPFLLVVGVLLRSMPAFWRSCLVPCMPPGTAHHRQHCFVCVFFSSSYHLFCTSVLKTGTPKGQKCSKCIQLHLSKSAHGSWSSLYFTPMRCFPACLSDNLLYVSSVAG